VRLIWSEGALSQLETAVFYWIDGQVLRVLRVVDVRRDRESRTLP